MLVVVGNGEEALNKARLLAQTNATIRVVAEEPEPELADFLREGGHEHLAEKFAPKHLTGAKLVFVATGDEDQDRGDRRRGTPSGIPVNVVDRPDLCDFFTPAIVNRAPLAIAIGSEGTGPVLTQMIRAPHRRGVFAASR